MPEAATTRDITLTYKGSVTPKATKNLKSDPVVMDFSGTLTVGNVDATNEKAIQKEFQSEMDSRIKKQLSHLEDWMKEKEETLSSMEKKAETLKKMPMPKTASEATARAAAMKELTTLAEQLEEFPKQYQTIVTSWGSNCREQQRLIATQMAVKVARKATFDAKTWSIKSAQAFKATLIISGIALGLAATLLSGGFAAPIFGAVVATGIAVSGVSGLMQIVKDVGDNWNMEKRAYRKVSDELESLKAIFGKVDASSSSLAKHVTELMNLIKLREDNISGLEVGVAKKLGEISGYAKQMAELRKDPLISQGEIDTMLKTINKAFDELNAIKGKIAGIKAKNNEAQKLIDELSDLRINIDKLARHNPNTILGNIVGVLSNGDALLNLTGNLGGSLQSVSSIHR